MSVAATPLHAASLDDVEELRRRLMQHAVKLGIGEIDCREAILSARSLRIAGRLLWNALRHWEPDAVGGVTLSADPLVAAVLCAADEDGRALSGFIVRKRVKDHGMRRLVEGPPLRAGSRVVLVDDILNSGGTLQRAAAAIAPMGAQVVGVVVLLDFRAPARRFRARGWPLTAVFKLGEIGIRPVPPSGRVVPRHLWSWGPLGGGRRDTPTSAPWIDADGVVVGSDAGFVVALTLDGGERWRFVPGHGQHRPAVRSSPVVHGASVYVGADDGRLYCLRRRDGRPVWTAHLGDWVRSSPAVDADAGTVLVGGSDRSRSGRVSAVDLGSGRIRWQHPIRAWVRCSPLLDAERGQVVVGAGDGVLRALDRHTGRELWRHRTGGPIKYRASVDGDGVCYAGSLDEHLHAVDAASGALRWRRRTGALRTIPMILDDVVVIGTYWGRVVALERETGEVRWIASAGRRVDGGCAEVGDRLVIAGSLDHCVHLFDGDTGETLWRWDTGRAVCSRVAVRGSVFAVASRGAVHVFRLDGPG